jgi:hypothetical protein
MSIGQEVSITPPPLSELEPSHSGPPDWDGSGRMCETTRHGFPPVRHLPWPGPMESHIYPCWLSPANGGPSSTQILTWLHGARSQIASQLVNAGTTPTWQDLHKLWLVYLQKTQIYMTDITTYPPSGIDVLNVVWTALHTL